MSVLVAAAVFLAGMFFGTRLLAGLYGVLDLWYTIRTAWPSVLARAVGWTGATALMLLLLAGGWRWVFVAGMAAHVVVYVGAMCFIVYMGKRRLGPTPIVE